jgi:hypothetical protein
MLVLRISLPAVEPESFTHGLQFEREAGGRRALSAVDSGLELGSDERLTRLIDAVERVYELASCREHVAQALPEQLLGRASHELTVSRVDELEYVLRAVPHRDRRRRSS